jgi:hypothetical protein
MKQNWKIIEEFVSNANRLRQIFFDLPNSNLSLKELQIETEKDEIFAFVFHLLIEETKCRSNGANLPKLEMRADFCSIESWLKQVLSGLISEPFPTVEILLKKQKKPSVYVEFDYIFVVTKFLNSLARIFDPNLEIIDASSVINVGQYEVYRSLPEDLKVLIDSVFIVNVPRGVEAPFASGPSFRFELLNYVDFDSKTEFKNIPIELLDFDEGSDYGLPFGKRWSRRLVAKSFAYDKINFDTLKIGAFPKPVPRSLENANINFHVQLPENVGVELLHQNIFDNSCLQPEFMEYSSFTLHYAKFLEEIPTFLTQKLKNTDIFMHVPLLNQSKTGSKASLASFRALILATGIRGHLTADLLPPVDIHEILNFDSETTSACLLLGLAISSSSSSSSSLKSKIKNDQFKFFNKLFTMHLPSFQNCLGLEIPPILQLSATLSLGFFRFRSFDRGICQLLLKEIFRSLPMNVNFKPMEDSPLLSFIAAFTLGMCLMSSAYSRDPNNRQFAEDIQNQLQSHLIETGNKTQHKISVLIATAFINIDNSNFIALNLPWSRSLPDLLDKPEGVVFWCQLAYKLSQWNDLKSCFDIKDQGLDKLKLNFELLFETVCKPVEDSVWTDSAELGLFIYACNCLMANSAVLALKFASEKVENESLDFWIKKLKSFPILFNTDCDYFFQKIQMHLLTTYQYLLLCKCLIFAGTGDSVCWTLLRELMSHPLMFKYGNGKLFYSSIGFLFLGKGRLAVRTTKTTTTTTTTTTVTRIEKINHLAVASLLCTLAPIFPTSPVDPEFSFVPLLDSLWPLSTEPC